MSLTEIITLNILSKFLTIVYMTLQAKLYIITLSIFYGVACNLIHTTLTFTILIVPI